MRLVEFLIYLLEAHSQTLHRLAALFGDEMLLHMLEAAGEAEDEGELSAPALEPAAFRAAFPAAFPAAFKEEWFLPPAPGGGYSSPYAELEGAVHDFKLPAVLEFHLWAYPHYRAFIESGLTLDARIPGPGGDVGLWLVDDAVVKAEAWLSRLPIAEEFRKQAQSAAHVPWLRFRTQVLKRIGKRPMGPVY